MEIQAAATTSPLMSRIFCTFPECATCGQFFKETYARSYKPSGLKVLRCFPHCCPEHTPHSICGTSVSMQVAGHFQENEATSFVAFARFETCVEPSLTLGHHIPLEQVAREHGMWYPGVASAANDRVILFHFSGTSKGFWIYSWMSSASAVLRNTQHVFKAYLFQCVQVDQHHSLQVIGMAQSNGFSVIPYKQLTAASDFVPELRVEEPNTTSSFECHFIACPCEKPMFDDNYIRCNRANGRKQLRFSIWSCYSTS